MPENFIKPPPPKKPKLNDEKTCKICLTSKVNNVMLGPIMEQQDMVCHYFCILFCCGLPQEGDEKTDMVGFKVNDIKKHLPSIADKKCHFCNKPNAGSKCEEKDCERYFHVPCGMNNNVHFSFADGKIKCFCLDHSPILELPPVIELYERKKEHRTCKICFEAMPDKFIKTRCIFTPCCNDGFFHYVCLMRAGHNLGYYFNCPIEDCADNSKETLDEYRERGIHIPKRIALYENDFNPIKKLEEPYDILTFDERYPLDNTVQPVICDYKNCVGANRGNLTDEIEHCISCGVNFAHKKCLYYFKGKWNLLKQPTVPKRLKFECHDCLSKYCISKI